MSAHVGVEQSQPLEVEKEVVAAVLTHRGRIGLFQRSRSVQGDVGRWHCITGFLPSNGDPLSQALVEIEEEVGIRESALTLRNTALLEIKGEDGILWTIHAFHFQSLTEDLHLNWEHDAAVWVHLDKLHMLPMVTWFGNVLEALSATVSPHRQ